VKDRSSRVNLSPDPRQTANPRDKILITSPNELLSEAEEVSSYISYE